MFGSRTRRELAEARDQRDAAEAQRDAAIAQAETATARAEELKRRYEPPVEVRRVVPSGFESNRRRH